jgi:hypothetical protein
MMVIVKQPGWMHFVEIGSVSVPEVKHLRYVRTDAMQCRIVRPVRLRAVAIQSA